MKLKRRYRGNRRDF